MPIQSQYTPDVYEGDGIEDTFTFTFRILAKADLTVMVRTSADIVTTLELNSDYTIDNSDVDAAGGGDVVLTDPLADGSKIFLIRNTTRTQLVNIIEGSPFPAEVVTRVFDRHLMMIQELYYLNRKALKFANSSEFLDIDVPEPEAGALLQWNSDETALQNVIASTLGLTHTIVTVDVLAGESTIVIAHGLGSSSAKLIGFTPTWQTGFQFVSQDDDNITIETSAECPLGGGTIVAEVAI